jgi:hypothetical protein
MEREEMILEAHYNRVEGHFGVEKTVSEIQQHFCWLKLQQDVSNYIRSCMACAISKLAIKKKGMYTPLPTPDIP